MKILVTGATGFIGKRLVERLLEEGHDCVCLVRKTSKVGFLAGKGIPLITSDVTDAAQVKEAFSKTRPEVVFHCAARVKDTDENLYRANALGTRNICRACLEYGVSRLVYLSSVAVISGNPDVPLTDDLPYKTTNAYGRSKAEAERIVVDFRRKGLRAAIIRPCMVYGEEEPHVLDGILRAVVSRRIPVFDFPGMDARLQLAYVDNVVRMMELALQKEEALEGTYIAADREVITIRDFFEILYDGSGSGRPPVVPGWVVNIGMFIPFIRRKMNRYFKDRVYDISRARDILGYVPEISTEAGLKRTVKYWREKCRK